MKLIPNLTKNDRHLLTAFIAQRMELGEKEWYVNSSHVFSKSRYNSFKPEKIIHNPLTQHTTVDNRKQDSFLSLTEKGQENAVSARDALLELKSTVSDCLRCPLGEMRTNLVFGDGNPDADIMFIGEAPGADEDKQGLPFVGRAGKLLTKMIEAMKLRREDVYIGNILKCRPPQNRDPKTEEIEECEPILIRQIEIIKPKIICALGRISGQTLLRSKSTLGALREIIHDYHGVKLIVTYHPAALLRNPHWKTPAWEDLKLLRREYDGMEL